MDKYEYRMKTEQMLEYMGQKSFKKAMLIADSIDWQKVKNAGVLCAASEVYEYNGEYEKSREILFIAYDRSPSSRKIVYRLGTLALKMGDISEATDCYEEFVAMAPKDPNQYILRYKILKTQQAPIAQQIEALEDFKKAEYVEKWAYELAKLYHEAGMVPECLEECDDLILWFSEGRYVYQAMELKMQYKPLTPLQQEKYLHRNDSADAVKEAPIEKKETEESAEETVEESAETMEEPEATVEETVEEAGEPEVTVEETVEEEEEPEEAVEEVEEEGKESEEAVEEVVKEEEESEEAVEEVEEEGKESEEAVEEVVKEEEESEEAVEETVEEAEKPAEQTSKISVEEILQNWEEKQKENAQLIQEEQKKAQQEKEKQESEKVEEVDSILPDDIRQLMEELEAEAAEIQTNKTRQAVPKRESKPVVEPTLRNIAKGFEEPEVEDPEEEEFFGEDRFEDVESESFEEIEEVPEVHEAEGLKFGDTQSIAVMAKALMNDKIIEEPVEEKTMEIPKPSSPFDTGFIVQGRYDLEAQSEIGLKAGLTEEQKKLFSYFVPVHGMSEQIVDVLEHDKKCKTRYGTSRTANLLIVGRKGSGKTVLAVDIVKAIQKTRRLKQGKVGIVTAESLNKKDVSQILEKLHGGAIIIERASKMNKKTIAQLNELMEEQTGEMLVVLEEERRPLDKMLSANPAFKKKFTSRLELPVFINDELVTFAQTYAKENGYKIDEMGILALYSRIDLLQREESVVTVADVKEIMDSAIEHSQKMNVKRFVKKVFGKSKDQSDRIILQEQDFKA